MMKFLSIYFILTSLYANVLGSIIYETSWQNSFVGYAQSSQGDTWNFNSGFGTGTLGSTSAQVWIVTKRDTVNLLNLYNYQYSVPNQFQYIPSNATIVGLIATIYGNTNGNNIYLNQFNLIDTSSSTSNPNTIGNNIFSQNSLNENWNGLSSVIVGSTNSLSIWGTSFSNSQWISFLKSSSFGVQLGVSPNNDKHFNIYIYSILTTVYFNFTVGVASVSPSSVSGINGGVGVTIYGYGNFVQVNQVTNIKCKIGNNLGTVTFISGPSVSPPYLSCTIPSQSAPGTYLVSISLDGTTFTNDKVMLNYYVTCPTCVYGTCNQGACNCYPGWSGNTCNVPICSGLYSNCGAPNTGGTCTAPNTCVCSNGWTGLSCDQAICTNNCNGHGNCTSPNVCVCEANYDPTTFCEPICNTSCGNNQYCASPNNCTCTSFFEGSNCSIPTNATCVALNNCTNNGICIGEEVCSCNSGWSGPSCSQANCLSLNNCSSNGVCIAPYQCSCNTGWKGVQCEKPQCNSCLYGICTSPNNCSCEIGWTGTNCSTPVCSKCIGGSCISPNNCLCPQGTITIGTAPNIQCVPLLPPNCTNENNCSSHGICYLDNICVCNQGYSGNDCSLPLCINIICVPGNGICVAPDQCHCFTGWKGASCEIQDLAPQVISGKGSKPGGIIAAVVVIVILLIVLTLVVMYVLWRKGYFRPRRKRPKVITPEYSTVIFGDYLEKIYPTTEKDWEKFIQLFLEENYKLFYALVECLASSEHDILARNFIFFYEYHKMAVDLIKHTIKEEVENSDNENMLFRTNSLCTKLFKSYSKLVGCPYLFSVLGTPIAEIKQSVKEERLTMEIDPHQMDQVSDKLTNKWQLLLITQKIFTAIVRSKGEIPKSLSNICYHIQQIVKEKYPNFNKSIGSFWFLRFYCPALVAPHTYGLMNNPPDDILQRNLVLLGKILQNLANGVLFGTQEAGMDQLNDFLQENQPTLIQFYNDLCFNYELGPQDNMIIPPQVYENVLHYLHQKTVSSLEQLEEILDEEWMNKLEVVLKSLGPPEIPLAEEKK